MIYKVGDSAPALDDDTPWVAPTAAVMGKVRLRRDSSIWFGAVLRGDTELIDVGEGSNVQDGSVLHTDIGCPLTLGAGVTVGHNVTLHGCIIEENVLIGMGAIILNRARIRKNSIVGAGALVTEGKEFPEGSLIVGSPAKAVRTLDQAAFDAIKISSDVYVANGQRFARDLKEV